MEDNLEYISLQQATKYCDYTEEYLSLRARQGKLKAVKFGRNWVTKKEWTEEYLNKNQKSNIVSGLKLLSESKLEPSFLTESLKTLISKPEISKSSLQLGLSY
jgi:hypothetical protein